MIGLQAMCFWCIMMFNVMRYEFLYKTVKYDHNLNVIIEG